MIYNVNYLPIIQNNKIYNSEELLKNNITLINYNSLLKFLNIQINICFTEPYLLVLEMDFLKKQIFNVKYSIILTHDNKTIDLKLDTTKSFFVVEKNMQLNITIKKQELSIYFWKLQDINIYFLTKYNFENKILKNIETYINFLEYYFELITDFQTEDLIIPQYINDKIDSQKKYSIIELETSLLKDHDIYFLNSLKNKLENEIKKINKLLYNNIITYDNV